MHAESIAEVGGSLVTAVITGLCAFGGFAFADYAFFAFRSNLNMAAALLVLFGLVNLPLFVLWSHQTAHEIAVLAASRTRGTHDKISVPR